MTASKKASKNKKGTKPVQNTPSSNVLTIEVLQNGVVQAEGTWKLDTFFSKTVTFGTRSGCTLSVPYSSIPKTVKLFKVGRNKVSVLLDPRFQGHLNTGTKTGKLSEFLNPPGALADVFSVEQPLVVDLKKGARGIFQIYGFEIIFKVHKPLPVSSRKIPGFGAGHAPFALPKAETRLEKLATPLAIFLGTAIVVPLLVWLLSSSQKSTTSFGQLNDEQLLPFVHPVHYTYAPAVFGGAFELEKINRSVFTWVAEYQRRMDALDAGKSYESPLPILAHTIPHRYQDTKTQWNNLYSAETKKIYDTFNGKNASRFLQFSNLTSGFEATAAGGYRGSLVQRQNQRISDIKNAYRSIRSMVLTEHEYLKTHYASQDVKIKKLLDFPRTGRLLGAQPSEEFRKERNDFRGAQHYADAAKKTAFRAQLKEYMRRDADVMKPVKLVAHTRVVPRGYVTFRMTETPSENLWKNARLSMNPSLVPPMPTPRPTIDMQEVEMVVFSKREQIKSCYDSALRRNERLSGTLVLQWNVNSAGRAEAVKALRSTLTDRQLVECLRERMTTWRFPRPVNGTVTVSYPFKFVIAPDARAIR